MKRHVLALILSLTCFATSAQNRPAAPAHFGMVRFASPSGSAANDGFTTATPWSLSYALGQGGPPTVIILLPGTYPSIEITRAGTKLVSQPRWGAKVVGSAGAPGILTDNNVGNVTIDGIEVAGSGMDGIYLNGSNSIIRNCWIHDSSNTGVRARLNAGTLIERNLIERNGTDSAGGHGLSLSGTNFTIRGNVIRNNQGWGCRFYEASPSSSADCSFYNNLVYGNVAGVTVWSPSGQTNYVFNNTIISATNNCLIADYGVLCVTNNILVAAGPSPVLSLADGANVLWDYNLVSAAASQIGPHDVVAADPGFVNSGAGLYWLTAASPAIGAANPGVVPPIDFFGKRESSAADIGAFQYSGARATDTRILDPSAANGADYWAAVTSTPIAAGISTQPQNQTVNVGQNATFTVAAIGDAPLSYQWTFNGVNVGPISSSYTRSNCQLLDSGGILQVSVSNALGSVQSSPATLTVNQPGLQFYVAANGSDSNTGQSADSPWTLTKGISQLGPDVTIILMPGIYTGPVSIYNITNGMAGHPANVKSLTKWGAVIANSPGRGLGLGFTPYVSYLVIDGLCVSNSMGSDGIDLAGNNITLRNCWITGSYAQGVNASNFGCSNNVIEYNLIENNGTIAAGNPTNAHYHGLYLSGPNNIVRGNVIRNNNCGYGIHLFTSYAGVWNNQNYIYNNLTYGHTNAFGVTMWGAVDGGALPGTNYLTGNTILDGVALSYGAACITNNIIIASLLSPGIPMPGSIVRVPLVYADYNLSSVALSLLPLGLHNVVVGALGFVNSNNGLYWLTANSPARGVACSNVFAPVDFFGNPQSSVTDIGAFQYSAALAGDNRILDSSPANPDYWSPQ